MMFQAFVDALRHSQHLFSLIRMFFWVEPVLRIKCLVRIQTGAGGGGGGGAGGPDLPEKSQKYRVIWQYRSGSPEKSQLPSQHSMLGHHRHASETLLNGVSLAGQ